MTLMAGMVIACLIKELQVSSELRKMIGMGLLPETTVDNIIKESLLNIDKRVFHFRIVIVVETDL